MNKFNALCILQIIIAAKCLQAGEVIVPQSGTIYGSARPFLLSKDVFTNERWQQVYNSTAFGPVAPTTVYITALSFAGHHSGGTFDFTLPNVEIRASTTQNAADNQSQNFAANIGLDEALLFSGQLHLYDTG